MLAVPGIEQSTEPSSSQLEATYDTSWFQEYAKKNPNSTFGQLKTGYVEYDKTKDIHMTA